MFSVELAIALFVFIGLLIAVKEYLTQVDNQRQQEAFDQELEAIALRKSGRTLKIRSSDELE
jgi:hypothetical protein